ncbi:hypothetical protein C8J56DRAFT_774849 [Mycena floridula]|nr:hypothetical protein C8J56DRAFT_774849 [Mycena floridula]
MAVHEQTHLQLLDTAASIRGSSPMFWVPVPNGPIPTTEWSIVTYAQFHAQVLAAQSSYSSKFAEFGFPPGSVIGVWLSGTKYTDLVHNLAISAAGYIPQMFSVYWSHSQLVFNMLSTSGAKALVWDSTVVDDIGNCPRPTIDIASIDIEGRETRGKRLYNGNISFEAVKDDVVLMLHTSGSTSGLPKIIPWTNRWISSIFLKYQFLDPSTSQTPDVTVRIGNYQHAATLMGYLGNSLYRGVSTVMPSSVLFGTEEMTNMMKFCGLNRLLRFGTTLQNTLETAQTDPEVLSRLRSLREITYSGTSLTQEVQIWAVENGLTLRTLIASSEVGMMMSTTLGCIPSHLKPWPKMLCSFVDDSDSKGRLVELVVEPNSPDIPNISLAPDGRFYTGDLYERCEDGCYIFCGRNDDWIKCGVGCICETRAIEDAVRRVCADLIIDCVVVGQNRSGPALLVEATTKDADLPDIIIGRLSGFNEGRFAHERVDDPRLVLIVEAGTLPRTAVKGNIRRKAVEDVFAETLDDMYRAVVAPTAWMLG